MSSKKEKKRQWNVDVSRGSKRMRTGLHNSEIVLRFSRRRMSWWAAVYIGAVVACICQDKWLGIRLTSPYYFAKYSLLEYAMSSGIIEPSLAQSSATGIDGNGIHFLHNVEKKKYPLPGKISTRQLEVFSL